MDHIVVHNVVEGQWLKDVLNSGGHLAFVKARSSERWSTPQGKMCVRTRVGACACVCACARARVCQQREVTMGCLGVTVYSEVCGNYTTSFSPHPHLIFHKPSPRKQCVSSQALLSFPEPLAGFQKPIIIIIIKNLRTEPFVPKIHLHLELFAEEWEREMPVYSSEIYWQELLRHSISFSPFNFLI